MHFLSKDDELPPFVSIRSAGPSLLHAAALLLGTMGIVAIMIVLFRLATEPIPIPTSVTSPDHLSGPMPTFPSEILAMAVTVSTALAPTPVPPKPTPTYTMLGTPRPPDVCLTSTPKGSVCSQPQPPAPTPTPIQPCPVRPGQECIAQGGMVRWLPTPTFIPVSNMTSGSN
jgi:hypothetical protein